jgi:zinc ribbon protein
VPEAKCSNCGTELPPNSKFCPECGTPVASGDTVVEEVPVPEEVPAPVEPQVAERRLFGVPPSTVLLLLAVSGLVFAIVLFVLGEWPWALIVLGLSGLVGTGVYAQARRLPGETSRATMASLAGLDWARARGGVVVETVVAHGSARMELSRLRREVAALTADRRVRVRELGEASYDGNTAAEKELKERIKQLDDDVQAKEAQMAKVTIDVQERIGRAKLEVQPTQIEEPESKPNTARE